MRYLSILLLIIPLVGFGQNARDFSYDSTLAHYLGQIDTTRIKTHLKILASDSMQGRETGTPGQKMAADYLSSYFSSIGLENEAGSNAENDYLQKFSLYSYSYTNSVLTIGKDTLKPLDDYYSFDLLSDTIVQAGGTVFLGYGIDDEKYSNYPKEDISGKIGLILEGEPMDNGKFLLTGTNSQSEWSADFAKKRAAALDHGLVAILLVKPNFVAQQKRVKRYFSSNKMMDEPVSNAVLPRYTIGLETWNTIFPDHSFALLKADLEKGKEKIILRSKGNVRILYSENGIEVKTENVYGVIRGGKYPKQYVFLTAHYDHLGTKNGVIYNGADDDGSGTATVLELARVFKMAKNEDNGLKRTLVFMLTTGEEKGLLGSGYYAKNPIYPMDSTVADLNIDMIGRTDTDHLEETVEYIYPIGSKMLSADLNAILERSNEVYTDLKLDYRYDDPNDPDRLYYRSDHYNFARHGIPVIFFFRGLHADYHKPTDTMEKIEYDTILKVSKLIFATTWKVAEREEGLRKNGTEYR